MSNLSDIFTSTASASAVSDLGTFFGYSDPSQLTINGYYPFASNGYAYVANYTENSFDSFFDNGAGDISTSGKISTDAGNFYTDGSGNLTAAGYYGNGAGLDLSGNTGAFGGTANNANNASYASSAGSADYASNAGGADSASTAYGLGSGVDLSSGLVNGYSLDSLFDGSGSAYYAETARSASNATTGGGDLGYFFGLWDWSQVYINGVYPFHSDGSPAIGGGGGFSISAASDYSTFFDGGGNAQYSNHASTSNVGDFFFGTDPSSFEWNGFFPWTSSGAIAASSGHAVINLDGTDYYPHVSGGILTFTATP